MNIDNAVSTIMSKYVKTLHPTDTLKEVKETFDRFNIHHIPIMESHQLKGMVSKHDFRRLNDGMELSRHENKEEKERLKQFVIADMMEKKIITIKKEDPIRLAMQIFRGNHIHSLPVMDGDKLVGIITPMDVINELLEERMFPAPSNSQKILKEGFN